LRAICTASISRGVGLKLLVQIVLSSKLIYGYSFFEAVGLGALCTSIGIIIQYCMLASKYSNIRQLLRQIMMLSLSIIAFMVLLNVMLMVDLLKHNSYTLLWLPQQVTSFS
jgi:uncharacterized membrane protein YagU involved in acid resistance